MTDFSNLMSSLFLLLQNWSQAFLVYIYNIVIDSVQVIFDYLVTFTIYVVGLFPSGVPMPINTESLPSDSTFSACINAINWIFPISYFVSLLTVFAGAVVAYFIIAPLARWVKLLT